MKTLIAIGMVMAAALVQAERNAKFLSPFQIVNFPNDPCEAEDNKNGTCYTQKECTDRGGEVSGSCAAGYGVCCLFSLTCNGESSENSTFFESDGSESSGVCKVKVCKCQDNICQLRLDFSNFEIAGPSTSTNTHIKIVNGMIGDGAEVTQRTQCLEEQFAVTNPGGATPPVICGSNSNQHMYVDASDSCNELVFALATSSSARWNIKVTQYACDYENLAPKGCTQYFFDTTGEGMVQSFNYDGGKGTHLANQNQVVCVRREKQTERICWYADKPEIDFRLSSMDEKGVVNEQCCGYGDDGQQSSGYDCVFIPSASEQTKSVLVDGLGSAFCGNVAFVTMDGDDKDSAKTICSKRQPFQLTFRSDSYEFKDEATYLYDAETETTSGFKLMYKLT